MIFSKTVEYALQTIIYLSNKSEIKPAQQKEITQSLNIPHHYLGKILQSLTSSNIVGSRTGQYGGFYLKKSPDNITLCDILKIFEGERYFDECIIGFPGCDDATPCPLHNEWKSAKLILKKMMNENTIADWSKDLHKKLDHIKSLQIEK